MNYIESNNFSVECLDEQEIDVYDIEVEDNHNFFANDILVHNSNYIVLNDILKLIGADKENDLKKVEILDAFYKNNLSPIINKTLDNIVNNLHCAKNYIIMKREGIASKHIHLAKKMYVQWVLNSEGVQYAEPKLKIMGFTAIKSSTPSAIKRMFKDSFKSLMINGVEPTQLLIKQFHEEFRQLKPYEIAKPVKISDVEKYYDPITVFKTRAGRHIKGALFYNKALKDMNLEHKYNQIYSGDSIKMLNLKLPNKIHSDVVCYTDVIPKEFDIEKDIDYNGMWNLLFYDPMKTVFELCDWQIEKKRTLF